MNLEATMESPTQVATEKKPKVNHFLALRKEVDQYFKLNNISDKGEKKFLWTALFIVAVYLASYLTIVLSDLMPLAKLGLALVMGVFHALAAMNIVHDAVHKSAFKSNKWNDRFGLFFNLLGANTNNWRIQHNILHHKYTNVEGKDRDIDTGGLIRMSPNQPRKFMHRFQHIYQWVLYGFLHMNWITFKDFSQYKDFVRDGYIKEKDKAKEFRIMFLSKTFYWFYALVIPMLVLDLPIWQILLGFVAYQFTIGLYLSVVFQLAHVIENMDFPEGLKKDWMIHQLTTTSDFNPRNKFVAWMTGGLNNQVIHHLFPHISRVHYAKVNEIMTNYLAKHNLPYHSWPSFTSALVSHYRMVKKLALTD